MTIQEQIYQDTRDKLNSVGPGFCLAKWNQVTIHLGTGLNHSCHHPGPHRISESEVLRNPTHLHNTLHKKKCWKEMLEGKRPKECEYCWRIEDNTQEFSDRIFKSSEPWAAPTFEKIVNSYWMEDYYPTYVELSFSNRCNYKCLYCSPPFSSRWQAEARQYGPIVLPETTLDGPIDSVCELRCNQPEKNPLVKAFWKWWPELFKTLHTFRLTGGEPLLVEETYQCLHYIQEHYEENPNLDLSINTNLGLPDDKFEELIEIVRDLTENRKVRNFVLYTSIESDGKQAEYVRFGLDTEKFWSRIDRLLAELPLIRITIMGTYNILSVFSFDKLVEKVYQLKVKYDSKNRPWSNTCIGLDVSYLRWPEFLDVKYCTDEEKELIKKSGEIIDSYPKQFIPIDDEFHNPRIAGFDELEVGKVKRIYEYIEAEKVTPVSKLKKRKELKKFLETLDNRRKTDYKSTFPDLEI